jgi:hypothetical protein
VEPGTKVVFYTPAATDFETWVTIEIIDDSFPKEVFEEASQLLSQAGALPLFAATSAYFLAGSLIFKMIGGIGERLFDGKPHMSCSNEISFLASRGAEIGAHALLFANPRDLKELENKYYIKKVGRKYDLISKDDDNSSYDGEVPYVIAGLSGMKRDDLASFTPQVASAAVLSRFLSMGEGEGKLAGAVLEGLTHLPQFD